MVVTFATADERHGLSHPRLILHLVICLGQTADEEPNLNQYETSRVDMPSL